MLPSYTYPSPPVHKASRDSMQPKLCSHFFHFFFFSFSLFFPVLLAPVRMTRPDRYAFFGEHAGKDQIVGAGVIETAGWGDHQNR